MTRLTDSQLSYIFQNTLVSDHNGLQCRRRLTENGVPGTEYTCQGVSIFKDGKLKILAACGEPCTWICKEVSALAREVETLQRAAEVIDEARRVRP